MDGKNERARQIWAERTRKPRSALLRYVAASAARKAGRQADDCDSDHISRGVARERTGMGRNAAIFPAFVKSEKVNHVAAAWREGRRQRWARSLVK